jgi:hypothetical protein
MPADPTLPGENTYRPFVQAAFLDIPAWSLTPPKDFDLKQWATHLAHRSAQEPRNLLHHVRRIYLHIALKEPKELYGALLDLYLALGDKGERLRLRLFAKAKPLLPQEQTELFTRHQESGLQTQQPLPPSQHSVLGNFMTGAKRLTTQQSVTGKPTEWAGDPLELAREELNFGDISVAQQILEEAVMQSPQRLGLHYGLLEIYKHTHSLEDLISMRARLGDDLGLAQSAWNQTQTALENKER